MSNAAGTIESILTQLSNLLEPIQRDLAPDRARLTLAELGIVLTPAQVSSIASPLSSASGAARDMITLAAELTDAIDADDTGKIIEKAAGVIQKVIQTIEGFSQVKTAIDGLGLSLPAATINAIPERIFNYLLVRFSSTATGINELLEFFGILEREIFNESQPDAYTVSTFRFGRIVDWFQDPNAVLNELYGWGDSGFNGLSLLKRLENFLVAMGAPVMLDTGGPLPTLDMVLMQIKANTTAPTGLDFTLLSSFSTGVITIGEGEWKVELKLDFDLPFDTTATLRSDGSFSIEPPDPLGDYSGAIDLKLIADRSAASEGFILLGESGGSRLEMKKVTLKTGGDFTWNAGSGKTSGNFSIGGEVEGGKLYVSFENADGFLGKILGGVKLESDFDLGFGYSTANGLYFTGSSTLEIQLPWHVDLGPVELSAITISVGIDADRFPVGIGANIKAELGPLQAVVENMGIKADFVLKDDRSGNLGPVDLEIGFKPPRGVGLSLDAGAVKGGGYLYLDYDKGEYAGAMELSILEIVTVKAIGLISTKMPDGSDGFSLLIIISAEFTPIQLGFGFTLNGVGGLLGLNRTVVLQALRDGVRTGSIESILFPTDIVANAPKIISDLRTIFPPQQGKFLIGPMAKFGWGTPTLISLSFGLIIEIPGNIAILGVLKVNIPTEDLALILIQVNFVGTLDFDKKMLTFDASLFDSRVLFMTLEGDMALRLSWGDNPQFLFSVGGFHPSYEPPPLALPTMRRLAINILNYDWARIRVECYFAVTSNTVQFGAAAYLFFGFSAFNVNGEIGFDVLFRFSPFYFIMEIRGRLTLVVFGVDALSIKLKFSLEGPSPWRAKGTGSITILFWDIEVDFDVTWGEAKNTKLPPIEVMPLLVAELNKNDNWVAKLPASNTLLVTLRKLELEETELVLHPGGTLTVTQRAMPLEFTMERLGTQAPSDYDKLDLSLAKSGALTLERVTVKENFAPAQYENLSDSEKLSRKSFEKMKGGYTLSLGSASLKAGQMVKRTIAYELSTIDRKPYPILTLLRFRQVISGLMSRFFRGNAASKSPLSQLQKTQVQPIREKIATAGEGFTVAFNTNNKQFATQATFGSQAEAMQYMSSATMGDPQLKNSLHVIPNYEVNPS